MIKETSSDIEEIVRSTYGPNGSTVIITDDEGTPYATKDGVSVVKAIWYEDKYKDYITKLIRQASIKTLDEAGDGTTSTLILTNCIIQKGFNLIRKGTSYKDIKQTLDYLDNIVNNRLHLDSKQITSKEDFMSVAMVSSNGDKSISDIVVNAYMHSNVVKVERSSNTSDSLQSINGMKLLTTYHDTAFINNPAKKAIEFDRCQLLVIDGKLNRFDTISTIISREIPCVIIAEEINEDIMALLKQNHNRGTITVAPIKAPGMGQHRKNLLKDIATYSGGKLLDPKKSYSIKEYAGYLTGASIGKDSTILFNKDVPNEVEAIISDLRDYLETDISKYEKELTEARIENLEGKLSIIKVGGGSDIEVRERYDRVDDAVRAVRCAVDEGVVKGGGEYLYDLYEAITPSYMGGAKEILEVLKMPRIALNLDVVDPNIVDPSKVIRVSVNNAISVAKTLLSTKAIVLQRKNGFIN